MIDRLLIRHRTPVRAVSYVGGNGSAGQEAIIIETEIPTSNAKPSDCDIFGVKGLLQRPFSKILSGYLFEGIDKSILGEKEKESDYLVLRNRLEAFFKDIASMPKEVFKSCGEGYNIRIDRADVTGFAIEHDGNIVQMAGFYFDEVEWTFENKGNREGGQSGATFGNDRYYRDRIRQLRKRR